MNADEELKRIRALNKARAKRYYEANKAKVAERRKVLRQEKASPKNEVIEPEPEKEEPKAPKKLNIRIYKPISYEQALETMDEKMEEGATKKVYENSLKQLMDVLDAKDDIKQAFQSYKKTIEAIDSAKQKRFADRDYSDNSKKQFYKTILKLLEVLEINVSKEAMDAYVDKYNELDIKYRDAITERSVNGVMTFEEYLPQVEKKFGKLSKEYLIASLYKLHPFRDNLQISTASPASINNLDDKDDKNYLVLTNPRKKTMKIILNAYKTDNKYGKQIIDVPQELANDLWNYLKINDIQWDGDYVFGDKNLASFIKRMNEKLNLPITINTYRQMHVSTVKADAPAKERMQLAKKMMHSTKTSEVYRRPVLKMS